MLDVNRIVDDRQMRALTGLDMAAFCALEEPFASGCQQESRRPFFRAASAAAQGWRGTQRRAAQRWAKAFILGLTQFKNYLLEIKVLTKK